MLNLHKRHVLGYHWAGTTCDFVLVTTKGVEFFKCSAGDLQLSCMKTYKAAIGHYWYDSAHGVLLTASASPRLGELCTYFVRQPRGFQGPKFRVDLGLNVTDQ